MEILGFSSKLEREGMVHSEQDMSGWGTHSRYRGVPQNSEPLQKTQSLQASQTHSLRAPLSPGRSSLHLIPAMSVAATS